MPDIARIVSAEPVIHGVLKITWDDDYVGIVDLRPVIGRGNIFTYIEDPDRFEQVQVGEYGHAIIWVTDEGEEIDFGTDALRRRAERQTDLHLQAG